MCDLDTARMSRPWPPGGCCAKNTLYRTMECDVINTEVADSRFFRDFGKFLLDSTVQNMSMLLLCSIFVNS